MRIEDLLRLIDIEDNEIEKANFYFKLKGIELHDSIREYLSGFVTRKVKYNEIATAYRYDKRIRKVLYKYMGLFEEQLRAYVCNNYSDELKKLKFIPQITNSLDKEVSLFVTLDKLGFRLLLEQIALLSIFDIEKLFPKMMYMKKNLRAINRLRNAVSHNRFLLNCRDFDECSIEGINSSSLYSNIINFSNHLYGDIRINFLNEIRDCTVYILDSLEEEEARKQTSWNLLGDIILDI